MICVAALVIGAGAQWTNPACLIGWRRASGTLLTWHDLEHLDDVLSSTMPIGQGGEVAFLGQFRKG